MASFINNSYSYCPIIGELGPNLLSPICFTTSNGKRSPREGANYRAGICAGVLAASTFYQPTAKLLSTASNIFSAWQLHQLLGKCQNTRKFFILVKLALRVSSAIAIVFDYRASLALLLIENLVTSSYGIKLWVKKDFQIQLKWTVLHIATMIPYLASTAIPSTQLTRISLMACIALGVYSIYLKINNSFGKNFPGSPVELQQAYKSFSVTLTSVRACLSVVQLYLLKS